MICLKCGTELNDGSEFCSKCGTKVGLPAEEPNSMYQQNENKPGPTQVVVMPSGTAPLVMGLLGLFGGFIPIVKYITGLLSLLAIFIGASQRKKLKGAGLPTGKATAGIVLGVIAVLITVITIAFSAMVIGSLFSGGGSSKSTIRINSFTNTLPKEIQGTMWSNGRENVEFGKNKVKLNDEWYSVKKITKGNTGTNWMFTWIDFSDRYITLQESSTSGLRLARLYREGARTDDFISGFMTPAEMEAERIEQERIANEIVGVWEGTYFLNGYYGFLTDATLNIQNHVNMDGQYQAVLNFEVTDVGGMFGAPFPVKTKGSCTLNMTYNKNKEHYFKFNAWFSKPKDFERLNFTGTIKDNVLSGDADGYVNPVPIRGSFKFERKN